MRLDKPVGILLLLWPCLWSFWIASNGNINSEKLILIILGSIITRSAGCVINDISDYAIDAQVERTKNRVLALKLWPHYKAYALFGLLIFFAACIAWKLSVLKSAIPAAFCLMVYPKCKKFLAIPQAWLAMTWGFSNIIVWDACGAEYSQSLMWLFCLTFFWTLAFDTLYAMADKEHDKKIAVNSMAIWLNDYEIVGIGACYAGMIIFWILLALSISKPVFFSSIGIALIAFSIIWFCKDKSSNKCLLAFKANNLLGCYIWILLVFK